MESSMSEAVEKAAASEMQDIQNELEKCTEERNAIAEVTSLLHLVYYLLEFSSIYPLFLTLGQSETHKKSRDMAEEG